MKKRTPLIVVVVALGALLAACLAPATPAPPPPPLQALPAVARGFDACAAPSITTMSKWRATSVFTRVGVYIGGANKGCAQPNLTAGWVSVAAAQGWGILPLWVGPQAPCSALGKATKISLNLGVANAQGQAEANAAANAADALGFGWLTPIYYDMEAYPRGGACTNAILNFTNGWIAGLNVRGYLAGMYASLCSGILDQAAGVQVGYAPLNGIWIAAWNNTPNIFGFSAPCALSNALWFNHQRVHQYIGGHNESHGGVTINIDTNAVDGPLARF